MQRDFHYHCIGVLARAAGFNKKDALTIAYASQYVDNATESEPIQIDHLTFDPVRTAHIGLEAYDWGVQKRVYIPFHFLPPSASQESNEPFVTKPNSPFARTIFEEACKEKSQKTRRLCRIGVALHTIADTWSHQGFSGRHHKENDVTGIHIRKGNKWNHLFWENIYLDFLPKIGHAEAGCFPDQPFLRWKYTRKATKTEVTRNNRDEFLVAAKTIYDLLRNAKKTKSDTPIPWGKIRDDIRKLLASRVQDVHRRCKKWEKCFQHLFDPLEFRYDERAWRNDALQPDDKSTTDWDDFSPSKFKSLAFSMKPGFHDSPWVHFHGAALRQRHLVLETFLR